MGLVRTCRWSQERAPSLEEHVSEAKFMPFTVVRMERLIPVRVCTMAQNASDSQEPRGATLTLPLKATRLWPVHGACSFYKKKADSTVLKHYR